MKILLFSDTHGPKKIKKLEAWASANGYDFGFGLGDFGLAEKASEQAAIDEAVRELPKALPNVYLLYGNHDNLDSVQAHPLWLKDGLHEISGNRIFVVNGIWGTNPNKLWHKRVGSLKPRMKEAGKVDMLLTHEHPFGLDYHYGSGKFKFNEKSEWHKAFAENVADILDPKIWLYGHSFTSVPDRIIPRLGIRTYGVDGRCVILDEKFWPVKRVELERI